MVNKDVLGRYEGNHRGNKPMYVIITYVGDVGFDSTYQYSYGAIGFPAMNTKTLRSDVELIEAVQTMIGNGYQKADDVEVLITEKSDDVPSIKDWLRL